MTPVEEAFRWARVHAARHMSACEQADLRWSEPSITEVVMAHAAQAAIVVPFTQPAEALSGADWVWWWVDGTSAYGMLVQAKRVTVTGSRWEFDFGYQARRQTRPRREVLFSAAQTLGLLPVYALYLGTGDYRTWQRCSREEHRSGRCLPCVKRTVSLMPALLADEILVNDSVSTYERSVALEDLWNPSQTRVPLMPTLPTQSIQELAAFLRTPQQGTRAVTRSMIARVLRVRLGQFSAVPTTLEAPAEDHDHLGRVFDEFPSDTGHRGLNYFDHILSPLKHAPPGYVLQILTGDFDEKLLASEMPENIAGIIVIPAPHHDP